MVEQMFNFPFYFQLSLMDLPVDAVDIDPDEIVFLRGLMRGYGMDFIIFEFD